LSDLPFKPGNVMIDYTNHAGVRAIREIVPLIQNAMRFGSTEWHIEEQWLLDAYDVKKDDMRTFAMAQIHRWWTPEDWIRENPR
jgi:predicted DNA-binding transcriptional regulator YafY